MANVNIISPVHASTSMGTAETPSAFNPSRPLLPRMLAVHLSLGKTGDAASHSTLDRLEGERKEIQIWSKKEMDHLLTVANRSWVEHAWSTVKTLADSFISVVSFVMGGYLLGGGDVTAGNFLIATGVFNILQSVFARQGMWDWITETLAEKNEAYAQRLKVAIPIIVSMLSLAFTVAGSRSLPPNKLLANLENVQSFILTGGQGVKSYLSIQKNLAQAQLVNVQSELKAHENLTELLARFLETSIKDIRRIKSTIKKPINALMQATTLASQKV